MRKPTLRERAAKYLYRTTWKHIYIEAWVHSWLQRAWLAGYRAGARDNRPPARYECVIGGCDKPDCAVCKHWKKER